MKYQLKNILPFIFVFILFTTFCTQYSTKNDITAGQGWKIVSFPDFFNFDVPEPWPQWDSAVNWFLNQVEKEKPDFVVITGDMVNGHWWNGTKCIEHMGALYYEGWKRRMKKHNLTYYVAVGDHEMGDDPWPEEKVKLVPDFERVYTQHMQMPCNGPEGKKGLAYYVRHKNLLLITVETFEIVNGKLLVTVGQEQINWFKNVVNENKDADFIVVQGHVPIFGDVQSRSSSELKLNDSTHSPLWKVMKESNVDLYLCGEFHAVTALEQDGIWQIVHGSSWGREVVNTMDYLVITVYKDELKLEMKSFPTEVKGSYMWNLNKEKGPREIVEIPDTIKEKGVEVIGTLTIKKSNGNKEYSNATGCFD